MASTTHQTQQTATQPLVTIGLPCYNSERYIAQAIESLLAQTFTDFKLIISDNASTDSTAAICQRYAAADARVEYTRNPVNIGLPRNFNRAFKLANSKYFKWATADDFSGPEMLADAVAILESDPSIALCYPRTVLVDAAGQETNRYVDKLNLMQDSPVERFVTLVSEIALVNHHLGLLRADAIRRTRLWGKHVGADIGFLAELSLYGKFCEIPKFQFFRRFHQDSSSFARGNTAHEARRYHAPRNRIPFNTWRFHSTYVRAVLRSPLSAGDKTKLGRLLIRKLYWDSRPLGQELIRDLPLIFRQP
jgi:glycosyltransferase involved in cell wall biosynthesis